MSDEKRYEIVNGKLRQIYGAKLEAILEEEALDPAVRNLRGAIEKKEGLFEDLRRERDILLNQSDWTQTSDSPLTDTKKAEWAVYRTTLRNFPATFLDDDGEVTADIWNPVWPTKPT